MRIMEASTDRRVRRTRGLLHQALIELMLERDYTRISVRDILDRADVGRSTFYAHYRDKDDLLLVSCGEYLRAAIGAALGDSTLGGQGGSAADGQGDSVSDGQDGSAANRHSGSAATQHSGPAADGVSMLLAPVATLFRLTAEHRNIYRALIGPKSSAVVLRAARQIYADILAEHLADRLDMAPTEFDATITYLSWGLVGLLGEVADPGIARPPAQAYRLFQELVGKGLHGRLRPS